MGEFLSRGSISADLDEILDGAQKYAQTFSLTAQPQAFLAYLFTTGRSVTNDEVKKIAKDKDAILDRWQLTGWAYQDNGHYTWKDVQALNARFEILIPDLELLITCPYGQMKQRKEFRQSSGIKKEHPLSEEREFEIALNFEDISTAPAGDVDERHRIYKIENGGIAESFSQQIEQAVPAYLVVEDVLRMRGYKIKRGKFELTEDMKQRIYSQHRVPNE